MSAVSLDHAGRPSTNRRYKVAIAIAFAFFVAYFDRTNVAVLIANATFNHDLGITGNKVDQGLLLTAFLFPYGLSNLVTGPIGDRLGGRKGVILALISWTIVMAISGLVSSFGAMLVLRILLGFGESIMTPACNMIVAQWFPDRERARANSAWLAGLFLAPAFSFPVLAWIVATFGWRASFFVLAAIGLFVGVPLMWFWAKDRPEDDTHVGADELAYIRSGQAIAAQVSRDVFRRQLAKVFGNYKYWLGVLSYCGYTVGFWGVSTFMPSYVEHVRHQSFAASSLFAVLPWIAAAILTVIGGIVGDRRQRIRAQLWSFGYILAAVLSYFGVVTGSLGVSILLISLAIGLLAGTLGPMWAIVQEMSPHEVTGFSTGWFNGITYMVGAGGPAVMGAIVDATHSYNDGFYVLAAWLIFTALVIIPLWSGHLRAEKSLAA